jgi:hypothetical protein
MTQTVLQTIEEYAKQATPGPLAISERRNDPCGPGYPVRSVAPPDADGNTPATTAAFSALSDARFYAVAREHVFALIEEARHLRLENERLNEMYACVIRMEVNGPICKVHIVNLTEPDGRVEYAIYRDDKPMPSRVFTMLLDAYQAARKLAFGEEETTCLPK